MTRAARPSPRPSSSGLPHIARRGVRVDEFRRVARGPAEPRVMCERVAAAEHPVGIPRGEVTPDERHEGQREGLAVAQRGAGEDGLFDVGESAVAVVPQAHARCVGEGAPEHIEHVLGAARPLQPLVDDDAAHARTAARAARRRRDRERIECLDAVPRDAARHHPLPRVERHEPQSVIADRVCGVEAGWRQSNPAIAASRLAAPRLWRWIPGQRRARRARS